MFLDEPSIGSACILFGGDAYIIYELQVTFPNCSLVSLEHLLHWGGDILKFKFLDKKEKQQRCGSAVLQHLTISSF